MLVSTWNVNGLRARHAELCAWVAIERPDVLCLQEIKCSASEVPEPLMTLPEYFSFWHGAGGYSGVSLHLRRDRCRTPPEFSHPECDMETRIVQARVGELVFASVYVPNGGKDYPAKLEFLRQLAAWVDSVHARGDQLVLCGDMNVTRSDADVHPSERKPRAIGQRPDERALFEALLERGLTDVTRKLHPDAEDLYTWWPYWRSAREKNVGWRLDYVLASRALAERAESAQVRREIGRSDHAPLSVKLDAPSFAQQPQP